MKERQFTSMAQQRRFERQQHELEKIRQAKAAKNVDGKAVHNKLRIGEKKMTVEFIKDKETKTKVRYTATGEVSGSIYVDKDSELAKDAEIVLEIAKVTS
ncbi:MAG: hypothetical protein ACYTDW_21925 [Planctomycetota bacterium]|jgi:hypothetical protein